MSSTIRIELDASQRAAVAADGMRPTNIVAGAGTGKTTVLVERFLKLIRDDGIAPDRILALTFTLKAAAEMRQRIHRTVAQEMPALVDRMYGAWIMNFHQFGLRVVRDNAPVFGVDPDAGVVTPADFQRIQRHLLRDFVEGRIDGVPADFGGEMLPPTKLQSRFEMFFEIALKCRGDGFAPGVLRECLRPDDHAGYRAYVETIVAIGGAFQRELERRNLIDFAGMITLPALALAENASLRERYRGRFDHILVDEFQDTSMAQYRLLEALSGEGFPSVTVVGDRKQSIYRWRDARVENIRDFPGEPEPLRVNYRSRRQIIDLAHEFIRADADMAASGDAVPLEANRGDTRYPVVLFHPGEREDPDGEAQALVAWVQRLTGGDDALGLGTPDVSERLGYDDISVLVRTLKASGPLERVEAAFTRHRVPYAVVGGANSIETRALENWHALLSLLLPGERLRELLTVIEAEPFAVPDSAIHELLAGAGRRGGGVEWLGDEHLARLGDPAVASRLRDLRELVAELRERYATDGFGEFIGWAIENSALPMQLFAGGATESAVEDLTGEVLEVMDELSRRTTFDLADFLDHLGTAIDEKKFRDESDVRLPGGRVRIMTIHQSKGLEFPAVAIVGLKPPNDKRSKFFVSYDEGVFFSDKRKAHWRRGYDEAAQKAEEDRMERLESKCLLYVAMTRARDHLWVSTPYPEGMRKKQETLFAPLLECAKSVEPLVVVREAPVLEPPADPVERAAPAAGEAGADAEVALEQWADVVRRNRANDAAYRSPASPLVFVSWSALRDFAACPLRYRHRHLAGMDDGWGGGAASPGDEEGDVLDGVRIPKGVTPVDYGIFVHDALDRYMSDPDDGVESALTAAAGHAGLSGAAVNGARALLQEVIASDLGRPGDGLRTEAPVRARVGHVVLNGIVDRVERGSDGWRVIDYKVGIEKPEHEFQATFYAWVCGRALGEPVSASVCYLRAERTHCRDVDTGAVDIEDLATAVDLSISNGCFDATPGAVCASCDFNAICPSAQPRPDGGRSGG